MRKRFFLLALLLVLALPVVSLATDGQNSSLNVCDHNGDNVRNLTDVSLYSSCVDTFDVNGDGVHDLSDVSLYAANNQNDSWCRTNFSCAATVGVNSSYMSSANANGLAVCDINNDGVRNLSDVSLYAGCVGTFDVNGDGVHDLSDVSLYASNNQNNAWCHTNFRCVPNGGVDLTITDITVYPAVPKVGEDAVITMYVANSGSTTLTSGAGITNGYRYFQDFSAGMPDLVSNISASNPLNPGEVAYLAWKGHFNSAGVKSLQAKVDNANELAESNENNNNYSITINVSSEDNLAVCDLNNDSLRDLSDISIFSNCRATFDVNNDGIHNLVDVSLYASNYQNNAWCQANFRCAPTITDFTSYLKIADSRITNISGSYPIISTARVYWRSNIGSAGEYRYSKDMMAVRSLPWLTEGVSNDPNVTGNMFGSQVDLRNLDDNSNYYIELRKVLGTQVGEASAFTFTTGSSDSEDDLSEEETNVTKVKVCHVTGNTKNQTLEISQDALAAHLAHGDKVGVCDVVYYHPSDVNSLLANLKQNRNTEEESKYKQLVLDSSKKFAVNISENYQDQAAIFVAYGIDSSTKNFGSGERQAILADYFDTTGYADIKWDDVSRLANGEKIVGRNLAKEQAQVARALKTFEAVYGHKPNFKDAKEDLFWNTLMYRIRFTRDLAKEKVGIAKFQEIFGKTPTTPYDWSVVRALGYIK